jgi:ABC-type amino acid transport system permease subunit
LILQRIKILSYTDLTVKQNVEQIHAILKYYIKKANIATFFLLFFCLLYSFIVSYLETKNNIHGLIYWHVLFFQMVLS